MKKSVQKALNLLKFKEEYEKKGFLTLQFLNDLNEKLRDLENRKREELPFDEFFEEYYNNISSNILIPTNGNKPFKGFKSECKKRLKKIMKENDFLQEDIVRATNRYIDSYKSKNYEYMSLLKYFIHKRGEGSLLCNMVESLEEALEQERGIFRDAGEFIDNDDDNVI